MLLGLFHIWEESSAICFNLVFQFLPVGGSTYSILWEENLCTNGRIAPNIEEIFLLVLPKPQDRIQNSYLQNHVYLVSIINIYLYSTWMLINIFISGNQKTTLWGQVKKNSVRSLSRMRFSSHLCIRCVGGEQFSFKGCIK